MYRLILICILLVPCITSAQTLAPESEVTIRIAPEYPREGEKVIATVYAPGVDLNAATISWLKNSAVSETQADPSTIIQAPALGSVMTLGALIQTSDGNSHAATYDIRPTHVTLMSEGDTYTPPLYAGRALHSTGSMVRLHALAEFVTPAGSTINPSSLVYTWRRNGKVFAQGIGKATVVTEGPTFLSTDIIDVYVRTPDSIYGGEATIGIETRDPVVRAYVRDPLIGVMYHAALNAFTNIVADNEIQAEPYFATATDSNDPRLSYSWYIHDHQVFPNREHPSLLAVGVAAEASKEISLRIALQHLAIPLQKAVASLVITVDKNDPSAVFGF